MLGICQCFHALTLRCIMAGRICDEDISDTLQHTATHCSKMQHTATHCNTLQHTATHCSTLQQTAAHFNTAKVRHQLGRNLLSVSECVWVNMFFFGQGGGGPQKLFRILINCDLLLDIIRYYYGRRRSEISMTAKISKKKFHGSPRTIIKGINEVPVTQKTVLGIDWCCLYHCVRNSLLGLLEALCARILWFLRLENIRFFLIFSSLFVCMLARPLSSIQAFLPSFSTRLLCLVVAISLVCWLYMCACVFAPLYVYVKMCRWSERER